MKKRNGPLESSWKNEGMAIYCLLVPKRMNIAYIYTCSCGVVLMANGLWIHLCIQYIEDLKNGLPATLDLFSFSNSRYIYMSFFTKFFKQWQVEKSKATDTDIVDVIPCRHQPITNDSILPRKHQGIDCQPTSSSTKIPAVIISIIPWKSSCPFRALIL